MKISCFTVLALCTRMFIFKYKSTMEVIYLVNSSIKFQFSNKQHKNLKLIVMSSPYNLLVPQSIKFLQGGLGKPTSSRFAKVQKIIYELLYFCVDLFIVYKLIYIYIYIYSTLYHGCRFYYQRMLKIFPDPESSTEDSRQFFRFQQQKRFHERQMSQYGNYVFVLLFCLTP